MKRIVFFIILTVIFIATDNYCQGQELIRTSLKCKYGFVDKNGDVIVPCEYDDVGSFSEGLAAVKLYNKWGFIDKTGKEIIPCKYEDAHSFSEGLAAVELNGKWGFIDETGKEIIPCKYENTWGFSEGFALVGLWDQWGFIDKTGKEIVPCKYEWAGNFSEGLAAVKLNNKCGYIDKTGKEIIPCKYANPGVFSEGLARVELNGKYGFIDKTGKEIIPYKYDYAWDFKEGLACVELNDKWGFIDKTGKEIISCKYERAWNFNEGRATVKLSGKEFYIIHPSFVLFVKNYVEPKINEWQQKGKYEKTEEWQARVNETIRRDTINKLTKEAEKKFIRRGMSLSLELILGEYDADNEIFLITENNVFEKRMLVPVPRNRAPYFEESWKNVQYIPKYFIENDRLSIAEMTFKLPNGEEYKYSNQASLNYSIANIDYNFEPINIETANNTGTTKGNQTISTKTVTVGKSDVDIDIPVTSTVNEKTFAVIIANEEYDNESPAKFSLNNGRIFREYCIKTLGLPAKHILYKENATDKVMRTSIEWFTTLSSAFNKDFNIIFYYSGHGIPDKEKGTACLMPVNVSDVSSSYYLDDLYQKLGKLSNGNIFVFLDACFSGAQYGGKEREMLASVPTDYGVEIKTKQGALSGKTIVFAAAESGQTAFPYPEKQHGLFTYYLLRKLQESKGDITMGELNDYITTQVKQTSVKLQSLKLQTPTVQPSPAIKDKWTELKLK